MTGYQSKKQVRHADDITLNHLIDLRKLEAEVERFREAFWEYGSHKSSCIINLLKKRVRCDCGYVETARAALKEGE